MFELSPLSLPSLRTLETLILTGEQHAGVGVASSAASCLPPAGDDTIVLTLNREDEGTQHKCINP